jgi:hypothetical protein
MASDPIRTAIAIAIRATGACHVPRVRPVASARDSVGAAGIE